MILQTPPAQVDPKAVDALDPGNNRSDLDKDMFALSIGNLLAASIGGLLRVAEAKGELDHGGPKWVGWRYTGDRNDCFFVVGRRCFKSAEAACTAARCGNHKCETVGGGPASVACAK